MDELRNISSDQEEADASYVSLCKILYVVWRIIYLYWHSWYRCTCAVILLICACAYINNHFLTLEFLLYINILEKLEEHLLNVLNADYENSVSEEYLPWLFVVTGWGYVSAFFRQRKTKRYRTLQTKLSFLF